MSATRQDVINHVSAYVTRVYGDATEASFRKAFDANDSNADGRISLSELVVILGKSDLGWLLTRPVIAKEIIDVLDSDGDGFVEWSEFQKVFNS